MLSPCGHFDSVCNDIHSNSVYFIIIFFNLFFFTIIMNYFSHSDLNFVERKILFTTVKVKIERNSLAINFPILTVVACKCTSKTIQVESHWNSGMICSICVRVNILMLAEIMCVTNEISVDTFFSFSLSINKFHKR